MTQLASFQLKGEPAFSFFMYWKRAFLLLLFPARIFFLSLLTLQYTESDKVSTFFFCKAALCFFFFLLLFVLAQSHDNVAS